MIHRLVITMKDWRKKTTTDGPIIFEYGDGDGELLYRFYCLEKEDNLDGVVPSALFYGDSVLPNPSIEDVKALIDVDQTYNCDVVVCSVATKCKDPDCKDIIMINDDCYWKIS